RAVSSRVASSACRCRSSSMVLPSVATRIGSPPPAPAPAPLAAPPPVAAADPTPPSAARARPGRRTLAALRSSTPARKRRPPDGPRKAPLRLVMRPSGHARGGTRRGRASCLDARQERLHVALHVRLPHLEGQPLVHGRAHRRLVGEADVN